MEPHNPIAATQDVSSRGTGGLIVPRLSLDPGLKCRGARGERFHVVMIGQRNGSLQCAVGNLSQGAGVASRRRSRSFGAGGASRAATNTAKCAASKRLSIKRIVWQRPVCANLMYLGLQTFAARFYPKFLSTFPPCLRSRLIDPQSHNMTVAARATAERNVLVHLS